LWVEEAEAAGTIYCRRFVEPRAFDVKQFETGHKARQRERVDGELCNWSVGARVGFVIEYMNRAVACPQEIDVDGDGAWFVADGRPGRVDWLFGNDHHTVGFFKRGDIVLDEHIGTSTAIVVLSLASMKRCSCWMPVVVGANARNDQGGCVGGGVPLFLDGEAVEVKEGGRQYATPP
jgi:hypothetical protein